MSHQPGKPILARDLVVALPSPTTDLYTMLRRLGARGDQLAKEFIGQVVAEETAAVEEEMFPELNPSTHRPDVAAVARAQAAAVNFNEVCARARAADGRE